MGKILAIIQDPGIIFTAKLDWMQSFGEICIIGSIRVSLRYFYAPVMLISVTHSDSNQVWVFSFTIGMITGKCQYQSSRTVFI